MKEEKILSIDEKVKLVFKDTYNLYLKYKDISSASLDDWNALTENSHVISHKYDCDLCNHILTELLCVIEEKGMNQFENSTLHNAIDS